ncbi:low-specificity L-threonine aldolase [Actimicrobium sp. CCI2.3]|uniref:low-specificity L-threonine aldolase n=1 Tax=Actimicrobium sp. CCI2.3 TaxID=3048616 RepID=UPI002AB4CABE|nr:low-specificity L-threonine aldolase [Actimicrobium sp. CCI2.3]MDY7575199.1 low-specificity L-threonine aldolase [Actimicrobium sp. CCI2.3]MEB0022338.1 low-specificity L-threonine aldolase [Actimicrobium sp. CCI2.3]
MNHLIDLRSDTVTRPGPAMRAAMAAAEVGDDVYGDDPTVNRLQHVTAELFGYEAALFAPSGTQSNLIGLMAHCGRGDEYLVGQEAHTYKYEAGGAAVLGSIQPQPLPQQADGSLALADIAGAIKPDDVHFARTRLLALENTIGGRVLPRDYLDAATTLAHQRGLITHLDGARIFNAAVKQGISLQAATAGFDSVSVCLSKGLGAPIGSVLCGSRDMIQRALRWRKMLGGGLRQAGILAAAGLYALEHHVDRLAQDHDHATLLAIGLAEIDELTVSTPQTNILYADMAAAHCAPLEKYLLDNGITARITPHMRLVTHLDVSRDDVTRTIAAFKAYFQGAHR